MAWIETAFYTVTNLDQVEHLRIKQSREDKDCLTMLAVTVNAGHMTIFTIDKKYERALVELMHWIGQIARGNAYIRHEDLVAKMDELVKGASNGSSIS